MKLPFGKFKGEDLCDVELSYLKWLEEQDWIDSGLRKALNHEIERRTGDRSSVGYVKPGKVNLKL